MSLQRGPLRLVLLRSGGYDYAELELQRPIHLVARNNVGKTTLIAALQFLYIDQAKQMHFSHGWSDTRRHYFPGTGSFILFECMTPTGLQVVGFRGLGPVQGFHFERFAYTGAYQRSDFLDGRLPRSWEEVSRTLVKKDIRGLEPKNLRASLTGSGDTRGPAVGLVPLRRKGSYETFRFVFRNLLRLHRIDQTQLKRLFIDVCQPRIRKSSVDLREDYGDQFHRIEKEADDIEVLSGVARDIHTLVADFALRHDLRGRLVDAWHRIEARLLAEQQLVHRTLEVLHEDEREAITAARRHQSELQAASNQLEELGKRAGTLEEQMRQLVRLRDSVQRFDPEWETHRRRQLQVRLDDLITRVTGAARTDVRRVQRDLNRAKRAAREDQRVIDQWADTAVTWLRTHSQMSEDRLADVFRILNPSLLRRLVAADDLQVLDPDALLNALFRIADATSPDGFTAAGVVIPTTDSERPLAGMLDVETVRVRLAETRTQIEELEQTHADIQQRAKLEEQRKAVQSELEDARRLLDKWNGWQSRRLELAEAEAELANLARQAATLKKRQTQIQSAATASQLKAESIRREIKSTKHDFDRNKAQVGALSPPPTAWAEMELDPEDVRSGLDDLIKQYRRDYGQQNSLDRAVRERMAKVEHSTGGRHQGATEADTIQILKDEVAALERRQQVVQDHWMSLVESMRTAFSFLLDAVEEVKREVSRLTRALASRQVSNLEGIELSLVPQEDIIRRLKSHVQVETAPLFAGPGARSRAARDIQAWIQDRAKLELSELFDLRFSVVDVRGKKKTFASLSHIESQGTSTTIKVLVHLELLRTMLADDTVRLPFFLDEVATLDPPNLKALIAHATAMGFVPVVASPEARDCVDTLYFLRPGEGGLVLDETAMVELRRGEQPDVP